MREYGVEVEDRIIASCREDLVSMWSISDLDGGGNGYVPASKDVVLDVPFIPQPYPQYGGTCL